jgi:hypothetical protein
VTIGFSLLLIAVGAILRYAVTADVEGVQLDEVGLILMIVGAVGLVISLLYEALWAGERSRYYRFGVVSVIRPMDQTTLGGIKAFEAAGLRE